MPGEATEAAAPSVPEARPRILIVDDQRNMRTTTALLLRQHGYDVAEADSGEAALSRLLAEPFGLVIHDLKMAAPRGVAALSRLLAEPFDVVITDLKMAALDGVAVLRGALEIAPHTQVIVMTGY